MTDKQILAIKCAVADLMGALEAHEYGDSNLHDWKGHRQTIENLMEAFPLTTKN